MDDKILHNMLLKVAREAEYTNFEVEQINLESERLVIRYFLEREARKIVESTEIKEETLKEIFDKNKEIFIVEEKVKVDTIFTKTKENAEKALAEVNAKNFEKIKEKYDEKSDDLKRMGDEFIFVSQIQPLIAEAINKDSKKGIIKKIVELDEGFHIIYVKEREAQRNANYEEAREVILNNVKNDLFSQAYNKLIENIANTPVNGEKNPEEKPEEKEEKKSN